MRVVIFVGVGVVVGYYFGGGNVNSVKIGEGYGVFWMFNWRR